ncbi:MAG: ADP-ribosylglycohydrolase family protein [Bacteroidales bacterium]|nr:ADP-ribosylglycohydrolase family protein [Bacteroidales bacterium]
MRYNSLAALVVVLGLMSCTGQEGPKALPSEVKMEKSVLQDKIRGAWAGQVIGCTYGGPTEFKYTGFMHDNFAIDWDVDRAKWYFEHSPGLYDDVYMDLTFVEVFDKEGLDAPVESFAKAYAYADYPLWHANLQGRYNIQHGIMPPESGHWRNNVHADDIDFQIEADYAGIMAPGMINSATGFADGIGHIMNSGDGWYGGVYVAAMYALAFISDDIPFIVTEALKTIPAESNYYKCMADVIGWWEQYPEDWHLTWALANERYGYDIGCSEGFNNPYDIDAVINSAYILIGLLYGEGDFYKTIDIATRCGQDSDCNPASAGGILGTIMGYSNIPSQWTDAIVKVEDMNFKYTDISLNRACDMSFRQALQVIERDGGSVSEDAVTIKVQQPQPVRLEQNFEGYYPTGRKDIKKPYTEVVDYAFEGKGVVVTYHFVLPTPYDGKGYEAVVDVIVDGQVCKTVSLPTAGRGQTRELCCIWDLNPGEHRISFDWKNKPKDVDLVINCLIPFADKK